MIVGEHTYGTENIHVLWGGNGRELYIGKYCSFALSCLVYLGGNHRTDFVTTYPFPRLSKIWPEAANIKDVEKSNGNVVIGNEVWVANNVTIQSGVNIGDGAVIAANSVVVKNCEPYGVYGGNPARLIKKRFSDEIIADLLEIKWWDWDIAKIRSAIFDLNSPDLTNFVKKYKK